METVKNSKKASLPVINYLQEGLMALVPDYKSGYKSTVITRKGSYPDSRAVSWLVKIVARHYCLDCSLMKKRGRTLLHKRSNISLVFSAGLVLIPVKLHVAKSESELATGYISLSEIESINLASAETGSKEPWLSKVKFKNGVQLATLNTPTTLCMRMRQGSEVLKDYRQRNEDGVKPLKVGELLKKAPKCDCPLYEIFLGKRAMNLVMQELLHNNASLEGYSQKTKDFLELLRSKARANKQSIEDRKEIMK